MSYGGTVGTFTFIGTLGAHPEPLSGPHDSPRVRLSVKQKDSKGNVHWAKVTAFDSIAQRALSHARKGMKLYLTGDLRCRVVDLANGSKLTTHEPVARDLQIVQWNDPEDAHNYPPVEASHQEQPVPNSAHPNTMPPQGQEMPPQGNPNGYHQQGQPAPNQAHPNTMPPQGQEMPPQGDPNGYHQQGQPAPNQAHPNTMPPQGHEMPPQGNPNGYPQQGQPAPTQVHPNTMPPQGQGMPPQGDPNGYPQQGQPDPTHVHPNTMPPQGQEAPQQNAPQNPNGFNPRGHGGSAHQGQPAPATPQTSNEPPLGARF
ncbi:single-stranded DNA-binding protein [Thioalkalivibrio sp. ALE19]|uniref:single-stranded DNA-binding protein n=1 Tax=Thioalkalivibrio sp. ALE19 TaxID=1266909 RepID=UPI0009DBF466|nr:single-stranded DNA-binding protein [Thioalkalivibrio sp. ALE19]